MANTVIESLYNVRTIGERIDGTTYIKNAFLAEKHFDSKLNFSLYKNSLATAYKELVMAEDNSLVKSGKATKEDLARSFNSAVAHINDAVEILESETGETFPRFKKYNVRAWFTTSQSALFKMQTQADFSDKREEKQWQVVQKALERELFKYLHELPMLDARGIVSNARNDRAVKASMEKAEKLIAKQAENDKTPAVKVEKTA